MKTNLSLSNEQASQIKAQNESVFNNLKAIRENESLSMEQKKQQMKAIKDAARQERMKVLTTEQQQKMEDLKKEKKHKGRK
jgi:protein CpxP